MLKKLLLITICTFTLAGSAFAQQSSDLKYRKYRVSLVPGISSNGINAPEYSAKYSLNLIAGYNGGLEGFEIGPININKHFSRGVQIGVYNGTDGDMSGLHFGGLVNWSGSHMSGLQFAGLVNGSGGEMKGLQFAGIANISGSSISGIQMAGIANVANGPLQGIQFAGITNVSQYDIQGIQMSGIANVAGSNVQGIQMAGITNVNNGLAQGVIISGIANISMDEGQGIFYAGGLNYSRMMQGVAISGVANVTGHMQGIQAAGLFNVADMGQGIQIGLFNYARDFEGVPVGLVSLYGNGRKNIDVWASDGGFTHIGFKTGTQSIYNMISIGYNPTITDRDVWALGWTIGAHRTLEEVWENDRYTGYFLNQDFSIQHIQDGGYNEGLNHIYSYRHLMGKHFNDRFSMYAGTTINMMVSKNANNDDYTWYSIHDMTRKGRDYKFWVGFTLGIQLL
jgi:hypothetical protein